MLGSLLRILLKWMKESEESKYKLECLDKRLRELSNEKKFEKFEDEIKSEFKIEYDTNTYLTYMDYVSSLFMVDIMNKSFKEKNIVLPSDLIVLDVGAGKWSYVNSLYAFLRNYQEERNVHLIGIDVPGRGYRKEAKKLSERISTEYISKDVFKLKERDKYDLVFMAHMLTRPIHFWSWGMRYRHSSKLFKKLFELLKTNGIFVAFAYEHAGEAAIFDHIPEDKIIYNKFYNYKLGKISNFLYGYNTFDDNEIILGKK